MRWLSNVAYTRASSNRDGCTSDTQLPFGMPGTLSMTSVHVRPPSRDTCRWPSSVPAYRMFARFGDSANDTIVGHVWMPSFLATVISLPFTPIVTTSSRFALPVRSAPSASQLRPRFDERNTRLPAP